MAISLDNRQKQVEIDSFKIKRAAKRIIEALGYPRHEVSILIIDDQEITKLNRQYFRRNRPTNVISFPMRGDNPAPCRALGDVVISAETAQRQAEEAGKKAEEEILFLLIHGILHLVGYDHESDREERLRMEEKERELFRRVQGV